MHLFKQGESHDGVSPAEGSPAERTAVAGNDPKEPESQRDEAPQEHAELMRERDELRRELARLQGTVDRLEAEIERYRNHAQRTSAIFLHATDYAAWMRENARRDAELTLRKSRARAKEMLSDVESQRELAQGELVRLQSLARETRHKLAEFTTSALRLLDEGSGVDDDSQPGPAVFEGVLQNRLQVRYDDGPNPAEPPLRGR